MSKTVKIPECMNPFEIIVNGKHYFYTAGTTQVVPDEVAAVIEHHEQMHKKQTAPAPAPSADNTLDLTKFTCKVNGTEQTFNDAMVALFQLSMQNNGAMGKVTFTDVSRELYKAANACNHPALMVHMIEDFVKWPTVYGFDNVGAGQLAANGILATQYGVVDAACIIQFDPPRESGEISVSAKILA
jgi:hypothetical protein